VPKQRERSAAVIWETNRELRPVNHHEPLWPIRSSSGRNPARRKTSAPRWVLATETLFRPRAICSTCSNQRMWCRLGSANRRSCCGPNAYTALARHRAETMPPSSKPFARRRAPPSGFGSRPIAIARVSSSVRRFLSITSTAIR